MAKKTSVYEATTDMFIRRCEERRAAGDLVAPWRKTWDPTFGMPRNMVTGKPYRGANVFFTLLSGFSSPFWLTFRQIKSLGGRIKREEDGKPQGYTPITFWWFPDRNNPEHEGRYPFAKFYQVWNTEQVSGIELHVSDKMTTLRENAEPINPIAEAQAIVDRWVSGPEISHRGGKCCYIPSADRIEIPHMQAFVNGEEYYRSLFHEMIHATGHRKRLDRDGIANPARFASHEYSEEELIAEMGAAMLAGYAGIASPESDENSAAYLDFWLKKLRAEPKMLEMSGRAAQKAVDMIRGIRWEKAGK